ncbi:MAG: bifunctional ornithine acetyltransferase/N-acetylglutamate synthase [Chloroflexi bacterium]|nr:bifunctional ornithine acetyltransferase/N-acetylglutamate synthase [Chloroflexota bacterium]
MPSAQDGALAPFDLDRVRQGLAEDEVRIEVHLNEGESSARVWTCDFSYDYVKINAEYHT